MIRVKPRVNSFNALKGAPYASTTPFSGPGLGWSRAAGLGCCFLTLLQDTTGGFLMADFRKANSITGSGTSEFQRM